jgi:hypothetical protein
VSRNRLLDTYCVEMSEQLSSLREPHPVSMVASGTRPTLRPGRYLREVRERLGLTLREVQEASRRLALLECNWDMYISAARLDQIENSFPILHRALRYSLSIFQMMPKLLVRLQESP